MLFLLLPRQSVAIHVEPAYEHGEEHQQKQQLEDFLPAWRHWQEGHSQQQPEEEQCDDVEL